MDASGSNYSFRLEVEETPFRKPTTFTLKSFFGNEALLSVAEGGYLCLPQDRF